MTFFGTFLLKKPKKKEEKLAIFKWFLGNMAKCS